MLQDWHSKYEMLKPLEEHFRLIVPAMDGVYVAHQGKISGWLTYKMFCKYKNTGKFPALIYLMIKLMGLTLEEMLDAMEILYLGGSEESIKRNCMENYTYYAHPEISGTKTKVYLWCGSKEPYAIKSDNILKKYLKNYEEEIMEGFGHGEFLMKHQEEICKKIYETL